MTSQSRITDHRFFQEVLFPPGGFADELTIDDLDSHENLNGYFDKALEKGNLDKLIALIIEGFSPISRSSENIFGRLARNATGDVINEYAEKLRHVESGEEAFCAIEQDTPHCVSFALSIDNLASSAAGKLKQRYDKYETEGMLERIPSFSDELREVNRGQLCGMVRAIERDAVVMMDLFTRLFTGFANAFRLRNSLLHIPWFIEHMGTEKDKDPNAPAGANHNNIVGDLITVEKAQEEDMGSGESLYINTVHAHLDAVCQKIDQLLAS